MKKLNRPLVTILSGGLSSEDYLSRRSCRVVYDSLIDSPFNLEILDWHKNGTVEKLSEPGGVVLFRWPSLQKCFEQYNGDVVFNCLHGENESAGQIQGFFTILGIPYTGNGLASSVIGMDKMISKDIFRRLEILTPMDFLLGHVYSIIPQDALDDIKMNGLHYPFLIKATHGGSSEGIALIKKAEDFSRVLEEWSLNDSLKECSIFAEEFIDGEEYCIGIFGHGNQGSLITLPIAKIIFPGKIFGKDTKFNNEYSIETGLKLPEPIVTDMEKAAKDVHRDLHFCGFSRMDFIVDGNSRVYALEVNTHPGMSRHSIITGMIKHSKDFSLKEAFIQMINWSIQDFNDSVAVDD
ncbi:MAG: ATP-grasp domain-containing protein [Spirochaetaceae bacterium]|nr:ATP-grasp domain-containing protein [Spirochaetaceae bacterium]